MALKLAETLDIQEMLDATIASWYDAEVWWSLKLEGGGEYSEEWHPIIRNIGEFPTELGE